jgi:hypothetical protein
MKWIPFAFTNEALLLYAGFRLFSTTNDAIWLKCRPVSAIESAHLCLCVLSREYNNRNKVEEKPVRCVSSLLFFLRTNKSYRCSISKIKEEASWQCDGIQNEERGPLNPSLSNREGKEVVEERYTHTVLLLSFLLGRSFFCFYFFKGNEEVAAANILDQSDVFKSTRKRMEHRVGI